MMGIHVQKSVKAAEQLIQAPDTSYEELLEQYAKMMKMQTLFAISSIAAVILSFIAIVLMFILGGLAFLQELPTDVQQYEDYYEEELGDFY
ncbi:YwnG [Bacillus altitudinis]|nr:YwnG [Bacillus altitudinis]